MMTDSEITMGATDNGKPSGADMTTDAGRTVSAETEGRFSRTELLFGPDGMARLRRARIAVFGLGGVGGYAVEALVRSGIGALDLIDHDRVSA